jgi:hypothetical protein
MRAPTQMRRSALLCGVAAATVFAACAAPEGVRPKWTLQASDFAPLTPRTTKEEVERRVGRPFLTMFFPRLEEEVWDYRYMFGVQTYVAEIHFDMHGQTKYTTHYPDRCPLRAVACR